MAYMDIIDKLRKKIPDISITTDVILGFSGESDADFEKTVKLVRRADFDGIFVFKYSSREGTKAYDMEDDVPKPLKKERQAELLALAKELSLAKRDAYVGKKVSVLFEKAEVGHSSQNYLVFKDGAKPGDIFDVKIKEVSGYRLMAE